MIRFGMFALLAAFFSPLSGCTLLVDRNTDQCKVVADCAALGAGEWSCQRGVCVATSYACTKTAECIGSLGENHFCRKDTLVCAALTSPQCSYVYGDYQSDEAVFFGMIGPYTGPDASNGVAGRNGAELAAGEIKGAVNGLPPRKGQTARRPIVLVGCDDQSTNRRAVENAKFLVDTVGVPVIIGLPFSGIAIDVATTVTIPAGVLLLSTAATSVALTGLTDEGLVWRTSPSDVFQAATFLQYVPEVEREIRQRLELTEADRVSLAIAHKGDVYGTGLGAAVEKELTLNGVAALSPPNRMNYRRVNYGNPDAPMGSINYEPTWQTIVRPPVGQDAPHIVLLLGTSETIDNLMVAIETHWDSVKFPDYKPIYLFADGGLVESLWNYIGSQNVLRKRVRGTVPGTTNPTFVGFTGAYKAQFGPTAPAASTFGAAGAYDAVYLLAYSIVSAGAEPITGRSLVTGLKKMVPPGHKVSVGTAAINATFTALGKGEQIDFDGASGALNFNVVTGEAPSDVQIWCLPKDGRGTALAGEASGLFLNAAKNMLEGSIDESICQLQ